VDDSQISALVAKLSRPHSSGGVVIERAAIMAEGTDFPAVIDWIIAHSGTPDAAVAPARSTGLHGSRINDGNDPAVRKALRFVLPADALR
jgi:hypothetical protein